jgi:flagellar basal-body rod modification protein FlgD
MIDMNAISAGRASQAADEKERTELGQQDFLKMMTAQLANQDPLNPMQSGDFMAQIAQFTSASGIQSLQASFEDFQLAMQSSKALQASTLVGREVMVESDRGRLAEGGSLEGMIALPADVENLTLTISDSAGQTVRQIELGAQPAGQAPFAWDGLDEDGEPMPAGEYRVTAQTRIDGENVSLQTLMDAEVLSVTLGRGGEPPRLNLEGIGEFSLANVRQVK